MLYLVRVGKNTRRGGFQELHSFAADVDAEHCAVIEHYQKQYDGFAVSVTKPKVLNLSLGTQPERQDYLTDVPVEYTKEEKEIADQISLIQDKIHNLHKETVPLKEELRGKITERIRHFDGANVGPYTKLDLYIRENNAWIRRLPIRGAVFAEHAGKGNWLSGKKGDAV